MGHNQPAGDPASLEMAFKAGMRSLAAGVSLITTMDEGTPHGLVATAVSSVSADPPTLLVCINQAASLHDPLKRTGLFCVNLLREADAGLAHRFSSPERRHERFESGKWLISERVAPVLEDAVVAFECEVVGQFPHGSHTIFLGAVRCVHDYSQDRSPLVYFNRGYRTLGNPVVA